MPHCMLVRTAKRSEASEHVATASGTNAQIDTLKEQLDIAVGAVEGLEGTLAATRDAASAQETELHYQIRDLQARRVALTLWHTVPL